LVNNLPLVSVNIPTLNSSATLGYCLKAIKKQTYKNIEIIIVDSYSSDSTVEVALKNGAKIYYAKGLLNQRLVGIHKSRGKYILLLDSDQILERSAIEKCVTLEKSLSKPKALILKEISVPLVKGRIANLQAEYVRIIHTGDWDPLLGTALPRFFPAKVLKEITPTSHEIGYFDHAYIYQCTIERGIKALFVPDAIVYHYEMNLPLRMLRKFYKFYGFYVVPALVENPRLVFSRLMPRRQILKNATSGACSVSQFLLYGAKALATLAGVLSYILFDIIGIAKNVISRQWVH